jgi:hypothetical protein
MDELVIVGDGQAFAAIDGDLARMKGPALLDDGVSLVGGEGGPGYRQKGRQQQKQNRPFHRDTT